MSKKNLNNKNSNSNVTKDAKVYRSTLIKSLSKSNFRQGMVAYYLKKKYIEVL